MYTSEGEHKNVDYLKMSKNKKTEEGGTKGLSPCCEDRNDAHAHGDSVIPEVQQFPFLIFREAISTSAKAEKRNGNASSV